MKHLLALTVMGLLVLPSTVAMAGAPDTRPRSNMANTVKDAGNMTVLWNAAAATGLLDELSEPEMKVTLLAPTDEAFAKLPKGELERLMMPENRNELAKLLKNHLLPGNILAATFDGKTLNLPNYAGVTLAIDGSSGTKKINGATMTGTDVVTSNGVIHVIDEVLIPKT